MISFIIPIYNAEAYLAQCIESILSQSGEHLLEVILIDDASTDASLSIAQAYSEKDSRITLLSQPHAGQSAARNLGLRNAKGQYIAFVDADDYISDDWCTQHMSAIQGVDYVQSGYYRERWIDGVKKETFVLPKHRYQFTATWARLYKREAIQSIAFTEGMIYEDVLYSVDLWTSGARCKQIDYAGYHYTSNPNSTTAHKHSQARHVVLRCLRERLKVCTIKHKAILLFTIIRLQLHFARL